MGEKIKLKEKISDEQRVIESIHIEPVQIVPPPPRRSSNVSHSTKRYLGILTKDVGKMFLIRDREYGDDPKSTLSQY